MKANELRIGNLIQIKNGVCPSLISNILTVDCIEDTPRIGVKEAPPLWGYFSEEETEPIPLTEEWLLKFGFEIEKDPPVDHWHFGINPYTQDWMILIKSLGAGFFYQNGYLRIPYVHSLQNLYFALTGEELELKY